MIEKGEGMRPRGIVSNSYGEAGASISFMNIVVQYNSKAERPDSEGQNLKLCHFDMV